ncbi:MAG: ketoacyl-ACP synthase III [Planctomycetota bacterium]|nr:ketoacyl-ACP synthase III [Planctomycetota bacterium]
MIARSSILGTGSYLPEKRITNADLERMVDTSDEWIMTRTGIRERRMAAPGQTTSDLAVEASRRALASAGIGAKDLDMIIVATLTPDALLPATACLVQHKLGARFVGSFDVVAACSGFVYSLSIADLFIRSGAARHVLVVGADVLSRVVDYTDRGTCVLFGDGSGAVIMGPGNGRAEVLYTKLHADGSGAQKLYIPAGGSALPASRETVDGRMHFIKLAGREIFRFAVTATAEAIREAMADLMLSPADIGAVIPHQANIRIIDSVAERLPIARDRYFLNLDRYGNTSAASIPIALDEAAGCGFLNPGKHVILAAFGEGLTWGSAVLRW